MTEWVEQRICFKFCIKLEYSSMETIQMIQKVIATGNCWSAASSGQFAHSCITSHAEILAKHQITQVIQPSLQSRFVTLQLLDFSKTKITFEREEISDRWWDSGKYGEVADRDWENYVKFQEAYFEGVWGILYLLQINVSIFHITWLYTFWIDLVCSSRDSFIWCSAA